MLPPGQRIGKFEVEDYLGEGGMSVVYRVRHAELNSVFALKLLTSPKPDVRDRLLREGRFQATLRHPNVVAVHDIIDIAGSTALLMEYVEGPTLDRWLKKHQPTLEEAESLFRGVVEGVSEAHAHGLVHRDLKPSNVLLAPTSVGYVPKVADFGIAKILESESEADTRQNVAMGTPYYMAPEQIRDARSVDERADIFSLGCILFELVCGGERSFEGGDILTVLNAVVAGKHLDPREYIPTLEDRIVRVIEGCLQVDRDKRFQNCQELLVAIGDDRGRSRVTRGVGEDYDAWSNEADLKRRQRWKTDSMLASTYPRIGLQGGANFGGDDEDTQPPWEFNDPDDTTAPRAFDAASALREVGSASPFDDEPTVPPIASSAHGALSEADEFTQPPMGRRKANLHNDDTEPGGQFIRSATPFDARTIVVAVLSGMVMGMGLLAAVLALTGRL